MSSMAEKTRIAIRSIGKKRFTSEDIAMEIGPCDLQDRKNIQQALYHLMKNKDIYRLNEKWNPGDGRKPMYIYTSSIKQHAADAIPDYKEPEKEPEEPVLNYADIGKAIIVRMNQLKKEALNLSDMLEDCQNLLDEERKSIYILNKRIKEQNEKIQVLEKRPTTYHDNGKFKLSEIAKVTHNV